VRVILVCLPLLFAAPSKIEWSAAHGIGIVVPNSWTILERDKEQRAFVVQGPKLSGSQPRLVVWNGGGAGDRTLKEIAELADSRISGRSGWTRTALAPHKVGRWPAMRLGYTFQEEGKPRGRGRVSIILYGGNVYVLEMGAAARGFPAATFDQIERSLEVKHESFTLAGKATVSVPPGWQARKTEKGLVAQGPRRAVVQLTREFSRDDAEGPPPPPTAHLDGKMEFQGGRYPVYSERRTINEVDVRMAWLWHDGWTAIVMMPAAAWDEVAPGAEAILDSLKVPPPPIGK
jgi:hypothetical protein